MSEFLYFCEVCDSINVSINEVLQTVSVPLTDSVSQVQKICRCNDCGAEIIIESESSKSVRAKVFEQGKKSIFHLLKSVNENGISDARIERVLGLSPHTLNRWKEGKKVSASALTLSRILAVFPELVSIAETGFEPIRSRHIIFNETRRWFCKNHIQADSINISFNHFSDSYKFCGVMFKENDQVSNDYELSLRLNKQANRELSLQV